MEKRVFEVSWLSLWRILFFIFLAIIFYLNWQIFAGLFLAIVISAGLDFFIDFLETKGLPRILGAILVFVLIGLIITIILYTVIPLVIIDLNNLTKNLNQYGLSSLVPFFSFKPSISDQFFSKNNSPLQLFLNLIGGATLTFSIIISSFYLSITKDGISRFIQAVFPDNYEPMALRIYEKSKIRISRWFRSQILLSITIFILVFAALWILGVRHAFVLALLAGLLEIVPYVGPIIAGGAATISAFTTSLPLAIYTLIIFIIIQQTENHLLVPLFMKKSVDLHPVIVIGALLIGANLAGVLGILISVPLTVVIQEVLEEFVAKNKKSRLNI
jgi:predicted PurR-regulated permease PerM